MFYKDRPNSLQATPTKRSMQTRIHPSAHVSSQAELGDGVIIGPGAVVGKRVRLGDRVRVGSFTILGSNDPLSDSDTIREAVVAADAVIGDHAVVSGPCKIGAKSRLGHHVVVSGPVEIRSSVEIHTGAAIGGPGEWPGRHNFDGEIRIGDRSVVREFCCVTKPVLTNATVIGNDCYLMARTVVDHDCVIEDHIKTGAGVTLGGSVHIGAHAYLGMNAVVHQGISIGAGAMVGMNSSVMRHVPPYATLINRRFTKINGRGLELRGATPQEIQTIERRYSFPELREDIAKNRWTAAIETFFDRIGHEPFSRYDPQL